VGTIIGTGNVILHEERKKKVEMSGCEDLHLHTWLLGTLHE